MRPHPPQTLKQAYDEMESGLTELLKEAKALRDPSHAEAMTAGVEASFYHVLKFRSAVAALSGRAAPEK